MSLSLYTISMDLAYILVYKRYIWVTYFIFDYQKSVVSLVNLTQYLGEHCRSCHNILESNANV